MLCETMCRPTVASKLLLQGALTCSLPMIVDQLHVLTYSPF